LPFISLALTRYGTRTHELTIEREREIERVSEREREGEGGRNLHLEHWPLGAAEKKTFFEPKLRKKMLRLPLGLKTCRVSVI
jgi:hypothetical protein